MRVFGPAAPPCPPGLTCGNVRPVVTGRGGGDGGVHGGGLFGPVKGLLGIAGGRQGMLLEVRRAYPAIHLVQVRFSALV